MKGELAIVKALLESGADTATQDADGFTALMWACLWGHSSVVTELLSRGANVGTQNKEGLTALMIAARRGDLAIVTDLLENGKEMDRHINLQEKISGWSALFFAAKGGHLEITKALLKAGADPTLKDTTGVTALQVAAANDRENSLGLLRACEEGDGESAATLLTAGADPNSETPMLKDKTGATALQVATTNDREDVSDELAEHMQEMPGQRRMSVQSLRALAAQSGQKVSELFGRLEQKLKTTTENLRKPRSYDAFTD
jgi:ankyrin repeat protein